MTNIHFEKIQKEFVFSFAKSSGPGGQHVNTTDTKVILNWNYLECSLLSEENKRCITEKLKNYINKENSFTLNSSKTRNRLRNKEDCLIKTKKLLEKAFFRQKRRIPTKPSKSSVNKRLDSKKKLSNQKEDRKKIDY